MKRTLPFPLDSTSLPRNLERLEMLLPPSMRPDSRELQTYALAFAERYKNEFFLLEREWDVLAIALDQAWQRASYEVVIRLVDALAYSIMRSCTLIEAERMLRMGLEASRHLCDARHTALFLSRLGCLLFSQGQYWQGRQLWYEGLQLHLAGSDSGFPGLWELSYCFAYVVDILGSYTEAQWFVKSTAQHYEHTVDVIENMAVALFIKGFYGRLTNVPEQAYNDLSTSLTYIAQISDCTTRSTSAIHHQLFMLVVQTELARVQGNYARAQQYAESTLTLAQVFQDRYTVAALLLDQGLFSCSQGQFADTVTVLAQLQTLSPHIKAPHVYGCRSFLEGNVTKVLPQQCELALSNMQEALSTREIEVLQLLARGLSNREIAHQLVVTQGTVKKHLEHIYGKLGVRSRTSALARAKMLDIIL